MTLVSIPDACEQQVTEHEHVLKPESLAAALVHKD